MFTTEQRSLRDPVVVKQRQQMLDEVQAVRRLEEWREALVPQFGPAEAGVEARVLILLEAPGPMANAVGERSGSGFISVDNDDPTAEYCWRGRYLVGLQTGVLYWNVVPWYLGPASVHPTATLVAQGVAELRVLLPLLLLILLSERLKSMTSSESYGASNGQHHPCLYHVGGCLP